MIPSIHEVPAVRQSGIVCVGLGGGNEALLNAWSCTVTGLRTSGSFLYNSENIPNTRKLKKND